MIRAVGIALLLISGAYSQNVNDTCECVEYFQCNYNGQVNEDGEGIIDIRTGVVDDNPFAQRRQCKHYLEVCCLPPEIKQGHDNNPVSPPVDPSNPLNPVNPNEQTQNPSPGDQGGNNDQITGIKGPHVSRGCGYRNPQGVGFRIQGNFNNEANFGEFPWTVAILRDDKVQDNTVRVYACGGTLIHKRAVLTAAHCVYGREASSLTVRAGEWDTQTTNEPLPHQDQKVSIVAMNPNYQTGSLQNNFAILILTKAVELADNVEVACLPEPNQNFDYSKCFATGWGKDQFGKEGHYQVILKAVELPVVPNNECQEALRRTRLGRYFKLHESFLCAGGAENTDTCTGDGGSPLVCPLGGSDPNRYTQAGIVSWGIGCGTKGVPGVYADVSKARLWIDETLRNYNMDISSYVPSADNGNNFNGNGLNRIGTVGLKPIGMRGNK